MPANSSVVQLRTVTDRPIVAGTLRLIPQSQVLGVRLPFGGVVLHWPTAITVEHSGRATQRLPIVDFTRLALIGVLLGTLVLSAMCLIVASRQQES